MTWSSLGFSSGSHKFTIGRRYWTASPIHCRWIYLPSVMQSFNSVRPKWCIGHSLNPPRLIRSETSTCCWIRPCRRRLTRFANELSIVPVVCFSMVPVGFSLTEQTFDVDCRRLLTIDVKMTILVSHGQENLSDRSFFINTLTNACLNTVEVLTRGSQRWGNHVVNYRRELSDSG